MIPDSDVPPFDRYTPGQFVLVVAIVTLCNRGSTDSIVHQLHINIGVATFTYIGLGALDNASLPISYFIAAAIEGMSEGLFN